MTLAVLSIPGSTRRLSEGVALKASVIARLLGIRLLTLDATVLLAPAEIAAPPAPAPVPTPGHRVGSVRPVGDGLVAAARFIEEGAASLSAARSSGPPPK